MPKALDKGGVLGCLRVTFLCLRAECLDMSGFQAAGHTPPPLWLGGRGCMLAALKFGVILKRPTIEWAVFRVSGFTFITSMALVIVRLLGSLEYLSPCKCPT